MYDAAEGRRSGICGLSGNERLLLRLLCPDDLQTLYFISELLLRLHLLIELLLLLALRLLELQLLFFDTIILRLQRLDLVLRLLYLPIIADCC